MSDPGLNCNNCGEPLTSQAGFCSSCGQSVKEISRPWLEFVRETLTELLDFDGRMLKSIRLLLTRPGFLSHEYINGRRVSYTSPIRIYLVVSLAFFFVLPLILPESTTANPDHKLSVDLYSRAMFLLLPLFAIFLKILYRRRFYIDHLVFAVHLFGAMYIVFAFILAFETLADRYLIVLLLQVVFLIYMVWYFIRALHTTYDESWGKSVLKFFALLLLFLPVLGVAIELASHEGIGTLAGS
jgi:hypothetical protein